MDQKKNSEQATDFSEAVDTQMKLNKEFHEKVKKERILKSDSMEQVNLITLASKTKKTEN